MALMVSPSGPRLTYPCAPLCVLVYVPVHVPRAFLAVSRYAVPRLPP